MKDEHMLTTQGEGMKGTSPYKEENFGVPELQYLPEWLKHVLSNAEADETLEGEHPTDTSETSIQIARWNLRIAQELIRQGLWTPTSKNLKMLHKLNLKYNISPLP